MWADNETTRDLLGFGVHAELIESVVTDATMLPIVLGVFGDWGGGKSSILQILQERLKVKKGVVTIYFSGWTFEGYEDAKTALISSILLQLHENRTWGPMLSGAIKNLLKRVKLMEVAKASAKAAIPLAAAYLGVLPTDLAGLAAIAGVSSNQSSEKEDKARDADKAVNIANLIDLDPKNADALGLRRFREDFAKLLGQTDIESLVVMIDDLDRCLPERIIDTLEAIKLFLSVPKTAFVVGADPRIVRHAIATRYLSRGSEGGTDYLHQELIKDYLEKLIQVPYHLPRLSPAEIETYINLLACDVTLSDRDREKILEARRASHKDNFYSTFNHAAIRQCLGKDTQIPPVLEAQLGWSAAISRVLADGLKGNPRQIKRMLNAMLLRRKLAGIAGIGIRDEVLAKLMVLEYCHNERFGELNNWSAAENGFPAQLATLEKSALENTAVRADDSTQLWASPSVRAWLQMPPALAGLDLRDYFWLARDRTSSTMSGVTLVPPLVRRTFDQLIGTKKGEHAIATRQALQFGSDERAQLLGLLREHGERYPDRIDTFDGIMRLVEAKVAEAARVFLDLVGSTPFPKLSRSVPPRLAQIGVLVPSLKTEVYALLQRISSSSGGAALAAKKELETK